MKIVLEFIANNLNLGFGGTKESAVLTHTHIAASFCSFNMCPFHIQGLFGRNFVAHIQNQPDSGTHRVNESYMQFSHFSVYQQIDIFEWLMKRSFNQIVICFDIVDFGSTFFSLLSLSSKNHINK